MIYEQKKGANLYDSHPVGVTGLEQNQVTTENNNTYENTPNHRWPESGTDFEKRPQIAPELQEIINRWDDLPEHIRQAIIALVKTHKEDLTV